MMPSYLFQCYECVEPQCAFQCSVIVVGDCYHRDSVESPLVFPSRHCDYERLVLVSTLSSCSVCQDDPGDCAYGVRLGADGHGGLVQKLIHLMGVYSHFISTTVIVVICVGLRIPQSSCWWEPSTCFHNRTSFHCRKCLCIGRNHSAKPVIQLFEWLCDATHVKLLLWWCHIG